MSLTITNIDQGSLFIGTPTVQDDTLTFAGADTLVRGTILARDSVSGKLVIVAAGGTTNENGIPKAILMSDTTAAGAGDKSVRVAVVARVNKRFLVIDADGDSSNVDAAVIDQLRDYGIIVHTVAQLSALDNA